LCPPVDNDPCYMMTGDPVLDNPVTRQPLEDALNSGLSNAQYPQLQNEVGGWCTSSGCDIVRTGSFSSATSGPRPTGAVAQFHTHPNVDKVDPRQPSRAFADVPSPRDISNARLPIRSGVNSYLITPYSLYRLSPDGSGGTNVSCWPRLDTKGSRPACQP
jgi:hypothetical protein